MAENKIINLFGDKKATDASEVKYSELLKEFVEPFIKQFPDDYEVDEMLTFTVQAWNFSLFSKTMPPEEFLVLVSPPEMPNKEKKLLHKMLAHKKNEFDKFDKFMLDFMIDNEKEGIVNLAVITGDIDDYFDSIKEEIMHQSIQEDYEENYINRQAIILKPQQPFLDWINSLYPEDEVSEIKDANIYLMDEEILDVEKWLKKKFDKFFMIELLGWHTNKKEWPQRRNYKMFKQWFQIDTSEMIYDVERRPILKDI